MNQLQSHKAEWVKTASESVIKRQIEAFKAMRSDVSPLIADPDLIKERVYQSFKLGALAGLVAAAAGGAAGAALGVPELGASIAGYYGLLGGTIKGQANANRDYLQEKGFDPKGINIFRYLAPNVGAAHVATTLLPESGHLSV